MEKKIIILIFSLILVSSLVSSQPQTIIFTGDEGYEIQAPVLQYFKVGVGGELVIRVFNKSDGELLTSADNIECFALVTNVNGSVLHTQKATPDIDYFNFILDENNITKSGLYGFTLHCNSTYFGGYLTSYFHANPTGYELTDSKSILYIGLFIVLIFLFTVLSYSISYLPDSNAKDPEDRIIKISYLKYLRSTLYFVLWIFILGIINLSYNLAYAYLNQGLVFNFFFTLYQICLGLTFPIIIVWFLWILAKIVEDKQLKSMMNRGLFEQKI